MKTRANKVHEEEGTLCCCEYVNRHGERSHIAACCCECEDLTTPKEPQKPESLSQVAAVVTDRIRVPWLWGGARKVDLSVIPPLILLPVLLHLAALHFLLGIVALIALPGLVLWYYYFTHRKKGKTLFFLSMALFSLAYMYFLFITEVLPRGDVGLAQLSVLTVGLFLTLQLFSIGSPQHGDLLQPPGRERPRHQRRAAGYDDDGTQPGGGVVGRIGGGAEESSQRNWCPACRAARPPRAGHCRICGICVLRLDHHCVWINNCVGQANHCSFLLTLVLFLLTSLYGISLVLQSVCPTQPLLTSLLYCPGVYSHTALCFTCAWYCSVVTAGLLHLLAAQVINVSHNVTEREARQALRDKTARRSLRSLYIPSALLGADKLLELVIR
uniref:Palmitoyltransferase n=1 Tax=Scophthalmus maximus TaxID=52904 RepID=A0A8D3BKZ6_SCOMX